MAKQLVTCRAFVLRTFNYSNTSQIIHCFSDAFGRIDILVKGNRNPKNVYYGLLQPLSSYEFVLYKKDDGLSLLVECAVIDDNFHLFSSYACGIIGYAAAELYLQLIIPIEDTKLFYELLRSFLSFLYTVPKNHILIFWRFLLRISKNLGIDLEVNRCLYCGCEEKKMVGVSLPRNTVICEDCAEKHCFRSVVVCRAETINLLQNLPTIGKHLTAYCVQSKVFFEVNQLFITLLSFHLHKKIHFHALTLFDV